MISREDVLNYIIDLTTEQDYLDLDNDTIDSYATAIYQRVVNNDTTFFNLPFTDTVMTHSIDEKQIRRVISMSVNSSKSARGGRTVLEFNRVKKDWFNSLFKLALDDSKRLYNAFNNICNAYEEENKNYLETGLLDSIYTNPKLLGDLNESLLKRGILFDEKDSDYFEKIKKTLPKLYLYWCSLFFVDNPDYLTETLMRLTLEKINVRDLDVSYYYQLFDDLDETIEDDLDELTEEEIEFLL